MGAGLQVGVAPLVVVGLLVWGEVGLLVGVGVGLLYRAKIARCGVRAVLPCSECKVSNVFDNWMSCCSVDVTRALEGRKLIVTQLLNILLACNQSSLQGNATKAQSVIFAVVA